MCVCKLILLRKKRCYTKGAVWIFIFHYSPLLTQFSSLITFQLKYPITLHKVYLAPSLNLSSPNIFQLFLGSYLSLGQLLLSFIYLFSFNSKYPNSLNHGKLQLCVLPFYSILCVHLHRMCQHHIHWSKLVIILHGH